MAIPPLGPIRAGYHVVPYKRDSWVPYSTESRVIMAARSISRPRRKGAEQVPDQQRILGAAFSAFMEKGYAETSTLEIATRARVSKRALYALVGNKQEMLVACISERAQRLRVPTDLPEPRDRATLARVLALFGAQLLREVSN